MPVPAPNLYPDFNTIRLSHVCFNVSDLERSRAFYCDMLGLQVTDQDDGHVYLRAMEERGHHSVILQKSDQPGTVEVLGFKTFDEEDLTDIEADTVIWAIGQQADISLIDPEPDVRRTERGMIECDLETMTTSAPDLFLAGDILKGFARRGADMQLSA